MTARVVALAAGVLLAVAGGIAMAGEPVQKATPQDETVARFLSRSGVNMKRRVKFVRFMGVIRTETAVRSVVKVIEPMPGKRLEQILACILSGTPAGLRPTPKIGDLEVFFEDQSKFTVEVGEGLYLITTSRGRYVFQSETLRKVLEEVLEVRFARSSGQ